MAQRILAVHRPGSRCGDLDVLDVGVVPIVCPTRVGAGAVVVGDLGQAALRVEQRVRQDVGVRRVGQIMSTLIRSRPAGTVNLIGRGRGAPSAGTGGSGPGADTGSVTVCRTAAGSLERAVGAVHRGRRVAGVVQVDGLRGGRAAVAGHVRAARGDAVERVATRAVTGGGARQLLRRPHRRVDVEQTGALLVGRRADVGGRAGQDLLDQRRRRLGATVRVGVGLDDVGRRAGHERAGLAGAAERLGDGVLRAVAACRAAGGLAAVARGHEVDHPVVGRGAARGQRGDVVVDPAGVAVGLRVQPQRVRAADGDHQRVGGRRGHRAAARRCRRRRRRR